MGVIAMKVLGVAFVAALCVASVAHAGEVADVEDPSNVADEFLDQLQFSEMDSQQSRGQLYADELKALSQVAAWNVNHHNDLGEGAGESGEYVLESAVAECDDQACRDAVTDIVHGAVDAAKLGESKDEKEEADPDPSCMITMPPSAVTKRFCASTPNTAIRF